MFKIVVLTISQTPQPRSGALVLADDRQRLPLENTGNIYTKPFSNQRQLDLAPFLFLDQSQTRPHCLSEPLSASATILHQGDAFVQCLNRPQGMDT